VTKTWRHEVRALPRVQPRRCVMSIAWAIYTLI